MEEFKKIGLVEINTEINGNYYNKILKYIEKAGLYELDILVFPELALSPYFPKTALIKEDYFVNEKNSFLQEIIEATAEIKTTVILPLAEDSAGKKYNSAFILGEGQIKGKYRKIHLPVLKTDSKYNNYEEEIFTPGNLGWPVFTHQGLRFGVQICYDRHFPEGFRQLALKGAQIIFLCSNSASFADPAREKFWNNLLQVRAYENTVFVAGTNKKGRENGWEFMGHSTVAGSDGKFEERLLVDDELLVYSIDISKNKLVRKRHPFLKQVKDRGV